MPDHELPTKLVLVIHDHQPVGNFDHVFAEATERSYEPFIELLSRHPRVRVGLHITGPLLEWLEDHRADLLSAVGELARSGQVEILGGGWSEPMLSALPEGDAIGQLRVMQAECERLFGVTPQGMWLAERVWDPDLPRILRASGMRYTLLDDTHFRHAGLLQERLTGYWVTEKAGHAVGLFPIDRALRYAIPFRPVDEAIETIRSAGPGATVTYGDDGEKFGVWPETWDWVWGKGWLEELFRRLEDPDQGVQPVLPSEILEKELPSGRVYPPTASYKEMGEWTLEPEAGQRLLELEARLEELGLSELAEPFVHGGIWMGFLAKYPETNILHKRMLRVSGKVGRMAASGHEDAREAVRALYRGQCNCPYWHGLFGGLYLPHLRHAVYRQLVEAEALADGTIDGVQLEVADLDGDLQEEVSLESTAATVWVDPAEGGHVIALDDRRKKVAFAHVLARRPETYHKALLEAARRSDQEPGGSGDGPRSIHDIQRSKVPDLEARLVYDERPRQVFVDSLLPAEDSVERLTRPGARTLAALSDLRFEIRRTEGGVGWASVELRGVAPLLHHHGATVSVTKWVRLDAPGRISAEWSLELTGGASLEATFVTELALALIQGDDRFGLELASPDEQETDSPRSPEQPGLARRVDRLVARSGLAGSGLILTPRTTAEVAWTPQLTVSQSEDGAELVYQGTVFALGWPVRLDPDEPAQIGLTVELI